MHVWGECLFSNVKIEFCAWWTKCFKIIDTNVPSQLILNFFFRIWFMYKGCGKMKYIGKCKKKGPKMRISFYWRVKVGCNLWLWKQTFMDSLLAEIGEKLRRMSTLVQLPLARGHFMRSCYVISTSIGKAQESVWQGLVCSMDHFEWMPPFVTTRALPCVSSKSTFPSPPMFKLVWKKLSKMVEEIRYQIISCRWRRHLD